MNSQIENSISHNDKILTKFKNNLYIKLPFKIKNQVKVCYAFTDNLRYIQEIMEKLKEIIWDVIHGFLKIQK